MHHGRHCEPFSGQKGTRLQDFVYTIYRHPAEAHPAPRAWTPTPISVWLARVSVVHVLRNSHCELLQTRTHTHTHTHTHTNTFGQSDKDEGTLSSYVGRRILSMWRRTAKSGAGAIWVLREPDCQTDSAATVADSSCSSASTTWQHKHNCICLFIVTFV